jgi:hypothetical protein
MESEYIYLNGNLLMMGICNFTVEKREYDWKGKRNKEEKFSTGFFTLFLYSRFFAFLTLTSSPQHPAVPLLQKENEK